MNTIGLSGQRLYGRSSLYYSCNFLVSLKLYQNKGSKKRGRIYLYLPFDNDTLCRMSLNLATVIFFKKAKSEI